MCGIAGIVPLNEQVRSGNNSSALNKMIETLRHRGPDDLGCWADPHHRVFLGHSRLAIMDVSTAGHQPMQSQSGRFVIVFNGEIYNFLHLRRELEQAGCCFHSQSDTEVILAAVENWGIRQTLDCLVGMFAIALWDQKEHRLHLCRDRVGEKPLYWGTVGGRLAFASELRAFRTLDGWHGEINRSALQLYLEHNAIPAPLSIYTQINKLPQATHLEIRLDLAKPEIESRRYWQPALAIEDRDFAESEEMLDMLLRQNLRESLHADVPLGLFLSGGIDSSLIASIAQDLSSAQLQTFTIGFPESEYSEAHDAATTAQQLGTEHNEIVVTESMAMEVVAEIPRIYDEPLADSSQIPQILLSRATRQQVTVALSGDGGDELFAGYPRYRMIPNLLELSARVPTQFIKGLQWLTASTPDSCLDGAIHALGKHRPSHFRYGNCAENLRAVLGALANGSAQALYEQVNSSKGSLISRIPGAKQAGTLYDESPVTADPRSMLHRDFLTYLPETVLTKVDRATMSASLESRAPFLDHRIIEFAYTLSTPHLQNRNHGKLLLVALLKRYLPGREFNRPKKGFNIPLEQWLRGPFRSWADELLDPGLLGQQGFFQTDTVRRYWDEHQSGKRNWHYHLWAVLMFQAWLHEQQ